MSAFWMGSRTVASLFHDSMPSCIQAGVSQNVGMAPRTINPSRTRIALLLIAFMGCSSLHAEQLAVVFGSFATRQAAENWAAEVSRRLDQSASVVDAEIGGSIYFRTVILIDNSELSELRERASTKTLTDVWTYRIADQVVLAPPPNQPPEKDEPANNVAEATETTISEEQSRELDNLLIPQEKEVSDAVSKPSAKKGRSPEERRRSRKLRDRRRNGS